MAYQGTTYDPARLLPFIEEARRKKLSEQDERDALKFQMEMEKQRLAMQKQLQSQEIAERKSALKRQEAEQKAITEYKMAVDRSGGKFGKHDIDPVGARTAIDLLAGRQVQGAGGSAVSDRDTGRSGSGGGGQQQQQASSDPMAGMSKDARLGMQLWQQQLAGSEADANLERQKSAEGITQKNKADLLRAELDWKSTEAQKDRDQQSRLAGGQRYLDELQIEISSLPETTDEEAILKAQAMDSVNMYQNDPVMLKKILDAMRRQRANTFGKQMAGKTISSMSNLPGIDIRNLTPQGGR